MLTSPRLEICSSLLCIRDLLATPDEVIYVVPIFLRSRVWSHFDQLKAMASTYFPSNLKALRNLPPVTEH